MIDRISHRYVRSSPGLSAEPPSKMPPVLAGLGIVIMLIHPVHPEVQVNSDDEATMHVREAALVHRGCPG